MKSLSSVGLGLSIVFACLLLALIGELYYLLWWKRRLTNREIGDDYSAPARELFYMFCLKKPSSLRNSQEVCSSVRITDTLVHHDRQDPSQIHSSKDNNPLLKPFSDEYDPVEAELMRLNSLSGPPRFLFTIIEETKEDLESEDGGKSSCGGGENAESRSLSDLLLTVETPYLTPLASPSLFTPRRTPMNATHHQFDSSNDAEVKRIIRSSPPPKFKFLQDAEEKLYRKILTEEAEKLRNQKNDSCCRIQDHHNKAATASSKFGKEEEDGPFITIIVDRNQEMEVNQLQQCHSSTSSQVLPLASSPSSFKTSEDKISSIFHQNFDPQVK